ncbi:MAG: YncE family protein, partial [Gammaproteobacteria bacterium]
MADKQIRRRTVLAAGGAGGAALAGGLGLNASAAGPAEAAGAMSSRQVGGGNVLELIGSLNTNFVQHDLAPEGAEMLTGSFTPAYSKVQIAVGSAIANYGTSRAGLLLYVGQPAIPGSRIYDNGGGPLPGVQAFPIGSVGGESGWASTTYRMVEVDVNPAQDVTWTVMAAIIGGANSVPTGVSPQKMSITPDGKKAYITNFGSGTVTPVKLGRPGYSLFNDLKPQDEAGTAIATGTWPLGVACDNTHAVVCNFLDATNKVTIIDVATDT